MLPVRKEAPHPQVLLTAAMCVNELEMLFAESFFWAVHPVKMYGRGDGAGQLTPLHESHQQACSDSESHTGKVWQLLTAGEV